MNIIRNADAVIKTTRTVINKSAGISFEKALTAMKEGSTVTRPAWKGNWIRKGTDLSGKLIFESGSVSITYGTWILSAEDIFADDWQIVARVGTRVDVEV